MLAHRKLIPLICFATLAVFSTSSGEAKAETVGVLGLEVSGTMDPGAVTLSKNLTSALRRHARRGRPYSLRDSASKDLSEMKLLMCESAKPSCMAQIGKTLGVDVLLYGSVKKSPKGYKVRLQLLDVRTARRIKSLPDLIPTAEIPATGRWARSLYNRLTGVPENGTLSITTNATSGSILIDGQSRGSLSGSATTVDNLPEGLHRISIEAPGYEPLKAQVTIVAGETKEVNFNLEAVSSIKDPADSGGGKGLSKALFWTSAGLTAAGGVFLTINWIGGVNGSKDDIKSEFDAIGLADGDFQDTLRPAGVPVGGSYNPCDVAQTRTDEAALAGLNSACDDNSKAKNLQLIGAGVTTVTGIAAAFFFYKAFLSGDDNDGKENAAAEGTVRVTPSVSPTSVGAGVEILF